MAVKVLIIDDSAVIRQVLAEILNKDPEIDVVGTANDPIIARDKIKQLNPDVLTLDVEMPRMDGITFLKNLMRLRPMPVVMISTLTHKGADVTLDALEIGAVDFVAKPQVDAAKLLMADYAIEITEKVISASKANVQIFEPQNFKARSNSSKTVVDVPVNLERPLIAIGASTGGTEAIKDLLRALPNNLPPVVITQHIPPEFSDSFAKRLNHNCDITVVHADLAQELQPGFAYLAPGGKHLRVEKRAGKLYCVPSGGKRVNRHMPSVEVMFDSVLDAVGKDAMIIMLTGMGADGAEAMLRLKSRGCHCLAQDEKSSVVWGMPGAAVALGAVDRVLGLSQIPHYVLKHLAKSP